MSYFEPPAYPALLAAIATNPAGIEVAATSSHPVVRLAAHLNPACPTTVHDTAARRERDRYVRAVAARRCSPDVAADLATARAPRYLVEALVQHDTVDAAVLDDLAERAGHDKRVAQRALCNPRLGTAPRRRLLDAEDQVLAGMGATAANAWVRDWAHAHVDAAEHHAGSRLASRVAAVAVGRHGAVVIGHASAHVAQVLVDNPWVQAMTPDPARHPMAALDVLVDSGRCGLDRDAVTIASGCVAALLVSAHGSIDPGVVNAAAATGPLGTLGAAQWQWVSRSSGHTPAMRAMGWRTRLPFEYWLHTLALCDIAEVTIELADTASAALQDQAAWTAFLAIADTSVGDLARLGPAVGARDRAGALPDVIGPAIAAAARL